MDEQLANKIDEIMEGWDRNYDYCQNNHTLSTYLALKLTEASYRLDPYPNGKSKDELLTIIKAVEAERDKTRNLLRDLLAESKKRHEKDNEDAGYHGSRHDSTTCRVCIRNAKTDTFLAETSSVKL